MFNIFKLATRNLLRYKRRTLLTSMLITLGVVAVLMFIAITGSFKSMMVGQITDSMIGHLQIHKKGYLASVDSLPLNRNLTGKQIDKITQVLDAEEAIEAYSMRIRLGAMFSNFTETTNLRLNAASPAEEIKTAYDEGAAMPVELHDGSRIVFRKVDADYDPTSRAAAFSFLRDSVNAGEIITGVLYIDEESGDMHDLSGSVDTPLSKIPFEELNPGSDTLDKLMERYR